MFNLSKKFAKKKDVSPAPIDKMLRENNEKYGLDSVSNPPSYNVLLNESRAKESDTLITEKLLEAERKDNDPKIVESAMEKESLRAKDKKKQVTDINVHSEAYDQKYREDYKKAKGVSKSTAFWDKYVGSQMIGEKTKVVNNISSSASQLQNNPDRFKSLQDVPFFDDLKGDYSKIKDSDIKTLEGFRKASFEENMSFLRDADAILFSIYYKNANKTLSDKDQNVIKAVSLAKNFILSNISRTSQHDAHLPDESKAKDHRDIDFHDGNPSVESPNSNANVQDMYEAYLRNISPEDNVTSKPSSPDKRATVSFNFSKKKVARKGEDPPQAFAPPIDRVPYRSQKPDDGHGYNLTTPGSEGLPGEAPDLSSTGLGVKERDDYPTDVSAYMDHNLGDQQKQKVPADQEPEDPFTPHPGDDRVPFGTGESTDYGQLLHDDQNVNDDDSALGVHNTVMRDVGLDRSIPTSVIPYNNTRSRPVLERIHDKQRG